jgi:hypothetical protein
MGTVVALQGEHRSLYPLSGMTVTTIGIIHRQIPRKRMKVCITLGSDLPDSK